MVKVKSSRSGRRRHEIEDDSEEGDVADVLSKFWEQRLELWRGDNDTASSHTADKVC